MAFGTHWEWRGFAAAAGSFAGQFAELPYQFAPQQIDDVYFWAPDLQVNLKIRQGAGGSLKIKRYFCRDGRLELWGEDPGDLFELPLQEAGWQALSEELDKANLTLGPTPDQPADHRRLRAILERAGCRTVLVRKEREGRWWQGPNGRVQVELAAISKPQHIFTIGLESQAIGSEGRGLSNAQATADIRAAAAALKLDRDSPLVMNYMDAVAVWAQGAMIGA